MKRIKRMMGLLAYMIFLMIATVSTSLATEAQGIEVGRIYYLEGDLLRYIPEENDWVAVVKDAPFGTGDTLFSGSKGRAEMISPNGSWIRIGNNSQIQFLGLEPDLTEIDVASGMARIYNKGTTTVIKASSPFGYVAADSGTVFDFYVGENSVEVVALKGTVSFVHSPSGSRYDVTASSPSILADQYYVTSGDGTADAAWDRWNNKREIAWATMKKTTGRSAEFLPPRLRYDAHCFDTYGRWELVIYEGTQRWFWRPTMVYAGWSPFTMGIWTIWCGDLTWIPAEPFGYITHHYGNWVYIGNFWYWAPPVVSVRIGYPVLNIGFFWYPGRVTWIHRGVYVGWVPLAPHETYYSHHHWGGPHHAVATNVNIIQVNINIRNYTYADRAIIVNNNNFHGVNDYRNVRVSNVHPTIINKYQAAPVVNNTVINNYTTNRQKYNYTNVTVKEKPNNNVINRINQNETIIRQDKTKSAEMLQKEVGNIRTGKIDRDARIEAPKVTNYLVPVVESNSPKSEMKLQQREIKDIAETSSVNNSLTSGKSEQQHGRSEKSTTQPEETTPAKSGQDIKVVTQPKVSTPSKSGELAKPSVQPDRVVLPARTTQQRSSAAQPEQTTPAKSGQDVKAVTQPKVSTPSKSGELAKPSVQPDRVVLPARTTQQRSSAAQPEQTTPAKSAQAEKTITQHSVVTPVNPGSQGGGAIFQATPTEKRVDNSKNVKQLKSTTKNRRSQEENEQRTSDETDRQSGNRATKNSYR